MGEIAYMNLETEELLPKKDALKQWRDEYDGGDPTNIMDFWEYYMIVDDVFIDF